MRIAYLDRTRAVAILMVVWIHAWDQFVLPSDFVRQFSGWTVHQLAHIIGRYGVPLFLMITGALMLDRQYKDIGGFIQSKIPRFIAALLVAAIVYATVFYAVSGKLPNDTIQRAINGNPVGASHLWYMYMLIGLYFTLPFIARLLSTMNESEVRLLITVAILIVVLPSTLKWFDVKIAYLISTTFLFSTYSLYALTGYWLHKYNGLSSLRVNNRVLLLVTVLFLTVVVKTLLDYEQGAPELKDRITWYDSLFIYIPTVLLFSIIRDYTDEQVKLSRFIGLLSASSFSIYLWHFIAVRIASHFSKMFYLHPAIWITITIMFGLLIGFGAFHLLKKSKLSWLVR